MKSDEVDKRLNKPFSYSGIELELSVDLQRDSLHSLNGFDLMFKSKVASNITSNAASLRKVQL